MDLSAEHRDMDNDFLLAYTIVDIVHIFIHYFCFTLEERHKKTFLVSSLLLCTEIQTCSSAFLYEQLAL